MTTSIFTTLGITKILCYIAVICVLLVASFLFYRHFYMPPEIQAKQTIPSTIISNAQLIETNDQGVMYYKFLSENSYHYKDDNRTVFFNITAYYYKPNEPYWKITADKGIALDGNNIVHLTGNIHVHQDAGINNSEATLTTQKMTLFPKKKIAQNKTLVTVSQPGLTVTSNGFNADFNTNQITLLSQAQGTLISKKRK